MDDYTSYLDVLCCPRCKGPLAPPEGDHLRCADSGCGTVFPVVGGRPVLIDEARSVFALADYRPVEPTASSASSGGAMQRLRDWARSVPSPSVNLSAVPCFARMKALLRERTAAPLVLVVGGGIMGKGMQTLASHPGIRLVNVDPSPASTAVVFCDAHDVPFRDGSVDAVVTQAVLEHVADPVRCADEIHRVLKPDGIVYSEIPFMQQVHQYGYDFTRFSHLGHRRLFRRFVELESGAVAGPGTALAWAWRYFLASFAQSRGLAKVLFWIGHVTGMLIEQFDYLFGQRPGALDAASCIYFFGTKTDRVLSDKELVAAYRGAQR
jgi:SAM-dependent methyltransferase/uncharacterized protein YbaR (Trm112 family)